MTVRYYEEPHPSKALIEEAAAEARESWYNCPYDQTFKEWWRLVYSTARYNRMMAIERAEREAGWDPTP